MTAPSAWEATNAPSKAASANRASWYGAAGVVVERNRDLTCQSLEPEPAHAVNDVFDLTAGDGGGLYGEHDQQTEEVRVTLERVGRPSR